MIARLLCSLGWHRWEKPGFCIIRRDGDVVTAKGIVGCSRPGCGAERDHHQTWKPR